MQIPFLSKPLNTGGPEAYALYPFRFSRYTFPRTASSTVGASCIRTADDSQIHYSSPHLPSRLHWTSVHCTSPLECSTTLNTSFFPLISVFSLFLTLEKASPFTLLPELENRVSSLTLPFPLPPQLNEWMCTLHPLGYKFHVVRAHYRTENVSA